MQALDIVYLLRRNIPRFNNYFTDEFQATDITATGGIVTITAASLPSDLSNGDFVNIVGAKTQIPITSIALETRPIQVTPTIMEEVQLAVVTTSTPHGRNIQFTPTINITGDLEPSYNGTFDIYSIDSPTVLTFKLSSTTPPSLGAPILFYEDLENFNGYKEIFNVTPTSFDYSYDVDELVYNSPPPLIRHSHRIVRDFPIERAIAQYTAQPDFTDMFMYVVLEDATVSKSRQIDSDATQTQNQGTVTRQRLIQSFSCYVFVNTTDFIDGGAARDLMETLAPDMTRSVLRTILPSPFAESSWSATTFLGHNAFSYNKAFLVHVFSFETVFDITECDSVIPYTESFNMNEIDIDYKKIKDDVTIMTSKILLNDDSN